MYHVYYRCHEINEKAVIAYIKGEVIHQSQDSLIVKTESIGYKIFVKPSFFTSLDEVPEVELFIYTHMKESSFELFGFESTQELSLFETLISVSGIGPKTGLAILAVGSPKQILNAIEAKDASFFQSVSGIGKRTANRVILELQDKLSSEDLLALTDSSKQDALEALLELGYKRAEAEAALSTVSSTKPEEQIREALKAL